MHFLKKYNELQVKVSILSNYGYNKEYVNKLGDALKFTSLEFGVDKVEKKSAHAGIEVDLKPLEKAIIENAPNVPKQLKEEIKKLNQEHSTTQEKIFNINNKLITYKEKLQNIESTVKRSSTSKKKIKDKYKKTIQ